ncbi:MAG: hypothetical protein EP344_07560 [Bacteroidetes bacterium]|nr:MAG: hypothetical protein EP344_07560 [Bacteroidota bacterium]
MKVATFHFLTLASTLLLWNTPARTQSFIAPAPDQPTSLFEYLVTPANPEISLSTDVSALITNRNTEEYQEGTISLNGGPALQIQVRPRGKFRRRISDIPPIKVKVKKKLLRSSGLVDSLNELKLVLPATLDEAGNELVVREYLVYRMFERVSPYAVRARLIDLRLINTSIKHEQQYYVKAILLEDEEETAARLGGKIDDVFGLNMDSLQTEQAALLTMFQYMIGNTDWSVESCRNLRFLRTGAGKLIPIPFDFDFCGFVDAPYATPNNDTPLRNVRDRYLMAGNLPAGQLSLAGRLLLAQRQAFVSLCQTDALSEKTSRTVIKYLESFFSEIQQKSR